jgi:hypothetical protein
VLPALCEQAADHVYDADADELAKRALGPL